MIHILAISFAPGVSTSDREALERRAGAAITPSLGSVATEIHSGAAFYVVHGGNGVVRVGTGSDRLFLGTAPASRADGSQPSHSSQEAHRKEPKLPSPFSAIQCQGNAIHGLVDAAGLQHLYWGSDGDCSATSTSSVILARLFGRQPSPQCFWGLSRVGNFLAADSIYEGIQKIRSGQRLTLSKGKADLRNKVTSPASIAPFDSLDQAVQTGVQVVSEIVNETLDVLPDTGVELSGGLDSRLILAAIGKDRLAGREALTLGHVGDEDVTLSKVLAKEYGLSHRIIALEGLDQLPADELLPLLREAAASCDFGANVFARAVLTWVNSKLGNAPRFSGQNGEFVRGFYYPGQVDSAQYGPEKIAALARWRIFTNQSIDPQIVKADLRAELESGLSQQITDAFPKGMGSWLRATDEFYLSPRMERWVGAGYSAESSTRPIIAPFFDARFLNWGRALSPSWKRRDQIPAALVSRLSPELAAMALANGTSPKALAAGGLGSRFRSSQQFAKKVVRNIGQRLRSGSKPPVGAGALCLRLTEEATAGELLPRVHNLDWIDGAGLQAALTGPAQNQWATLGYLLGLEWALEAIDQD